ncbi:ATP-binding protein [Methylobacterium sp. BE186]|uniref:ATP-binding protein n=1 Tax=Methylobacterium sp. BE186 TaxID=2817715 RepID=UPI00286D47A5|nr:ATP-binding protein [Methylobacterium sp. BE186]
MNPCALLERLLQEAGENGWLEFKHNNKDPNEIGEYISALANGAMLNDRDRAYLVFGIDNKTRNKVGTSVQFSEMKKGGEDFQNWASRQVEPKLLIEFLDFKCDGLSFSIVTIEPTYDRPVKFSGVEYIRIGENKKKLIDFPEHERALWLATGRRKFENAVALSNQTLDQVLEKIDTDVHYELSSETKPKKIDEVLKRMIAEGFINDNMDGTFDILNLGAILLAKDVHQFPSITSKSVRIIKYSGKDKSKSEFEQEGQKGYAHGFVGMMRFIMKNIPSEEVYIDGVRRNLSAYPEIAIREVLANALIHQDFTISGAGPIVEIYSNRIEIINPGNSLIDTDRMLDERRSRNEKLASTMRNFGLCEERGGGLDKTLLEIEKAHLPAPEFISSKNSMRVVLFGPKKFSAMTRQEKQRACFYHCVIRWITHDPMGNASLRERFLVSDEDYQAVSSVISEAVRANRIAPADPKQGKRNARYVPYWAV